MSSSSQLHDIVWSNATDGSDDSSRDRDYDSLWQAATPAPDGDLYDHIQNETTTASAPIVSVSSEAKDWILVMVLVGLIVVLSILFLMMIVPPIVKWIKKQIPIDPKILLARYETIEAWLITKVCISQMPISFEASIDKIQQYQQKRTVWCMV
jgi:hypothetical protein